MKTIIILIVALFVVWLGYGMLKNNETTTSGADVTTPTTKVPNQNSNTVTLTPSAPSVETMSTTATSNSTALVTGQVKPNGAGTSYWYEYGETSALGTRTTSQQIGSGYKFIPTPAYITGLKANTLYYFRLSGSNRFATTNGATHTFQTNTNPPPQGSAPTTRTTSATTISRTTANINGTVNPNNSATTYWFEYGTDTEFGNLTAFQQIGSGNSQISASVSLSDLAPLTKYYFRLNAQNGYGTVNGPILSFTTTGPSNPGQPTADTTSAKNVTSTSATFTGVINPNGAQVTYWFEYSEDSLLGQLIGSGTPEQTVSAGTKNVTVQTDINLIPKKKYYYRLVAKNQYGAVRGDIVSFTTNK
ncbi:MAG: Peptidase M23 [Parcubacteria group bacterium GW2011_GWF2_39_8b]|uniref:Fibronectin type-III domain-containing protein n=2 Tax=Candidatus Zambryskiibacteriota TaxID=1817925 RepID=A0A1G2T854_9BACT|nr:MAG: Peptidase M23 [Parcubacteria group bacterium GW2011_GWF2_39_8b]KKR45245.1 MAG: Peptidase M23 [Parcubacteria group bacterium GW2011_GWA2_40_14]OHA93456.1 MAG: hypothetical protein A2W58_02390 [Candidatus Zambryskibacteria bacterium RIFCSPHIGHO2_02_38_10.5]OHA95984.1 MAG: hypothetical protein A3C63_02165 [Candidatus Zambryskibacteria bacterium RIFCSPHIGHO2_02_FULL_39_82]OHA97709.1 MAG: hypothetical protein A3E32_00520 [Candidatus Zambryskibacteria bacterium RIFCSPHIGHO2_12_FULL_38_37]OHB